MSEPNYTHTVHCFDDKAKRRHFKGIEAATRYANELLAEGHKVKIYPYGPPKKYIDYVAERGPDG